MFPWSDMATHVKTAWYKHVISYIMVENTPDAFLPTLTAVFHSITFIFSPQQSRPTWVVPSWERGCMSYDCPILDNHVDLELVHFCRYHYHYIQVCIYTFSFESGQLWTRLKMGGYTKISGEEDKPKYYDNHISAISCQRYSNYIISVYTSTNNNQIQIIQQYAAKSKYCFPMEEYSWIQCSPDEPTNPTSHFWSWSLLDYVIWHMTTNAY